MKRNKYQKRVDHQLPTVQSSLGDTTTAQSLPIQTRNVRHPKVSYALEPLLGALSSQFPPFVVDAELTSPDEAYGGGAPAGGGTGGGANVASVGVVGSAFRTDNVPPAKSYSSASGERARAVSHCAASAAGGGGWRWVRLWWRVGGYCELLPCELIDEWAYRDDLGLESAPPPGPPMTWSTMCPSSTDAEPTTSGSMSLLCSDGGGQTCSWKIEPEDVARVPRRYGGFACCTGLSASIASASNGVFAPPPLLPRYRAEEAAETG